MNRIKNSNLLLAEAMIRQIMKECDACGMAAAIVDKEGGTLYENFFGYADRDAQKDLNEDTVFGLASVTKSFTALSVMQLEEAGILSIEDPVNKYIPEYTGFNQPSVTIGNFLNHSGGFFPLPRILVGEVAKNLGLEERSCGDFAYNTRIAEEGARLVSERLDAQTFENRGLNGMPGRHFSYCNDGYGLLSEIIRREGPEPSYADYLKRHILDPLHMDRSFCDFLRPSLDDNAATLYKRVNGTMVGSRDYHDNAFVLNGGGAMKSTLGDMKKYLCLYLNGGKTRKGERLLSEYRMGEMCRPRQPYLADGYYGYGLCLKQLDDLKVFGHGGSLPGVSSHMAWSREAEAGVIILCNTSDVPVSLISDALMRVYNGKSPVDSRDRYQETPWSLKTVEAAAGIYESGEGTRIEILKQEDGTPGVKENGVLKPLVPINPHAGFVRNTFTDNYLYLHRTENNGIDAITYQSRMIPRVFPV
ncbi:serine hydrolase domain-containing protein [Lachnospiraceae bacterium 54-53]